MKGGGDGEGFGVRDGGFSLVCKVSGFVKVGFIGREAMDFKVGKEKR